METKDNTQANQDETSEVKEEEATKEAPIKKDVKVSPEALLTALFICKYLHSKKEAKQYAFDKMWTRMTKITFIILNCLALLMLILFLSSYFHWFSGGSNVDMFMWSNAVMSGLIISLDLAWLFVFTYRWTQRKSLCSKGHAQKDEIYFLKNLIVCDAIIGEGDKVSKTEKVFNYSDIKRIFETRNFFFIIMVDNSEVSFYKPALPSKKNIDLETVRTKLEEETNKRIFISSYIPSIYYENIFNEELKRSKLIDLDKSLLIVSSIILFFSLFINYRDGMTLDSIYLFWISFFVDIAVLASLIVIKYNGQLSKRLFTSSIITMASIFAISLINIVGGNVYNIYNKFKNQAIAFNEMTKENLPVESTLNEERTSYQKEIFFGAFRYQITGNLTSEDEVKTFEESLDKSDSRWVKDIFSIYQRNNYFPSKTPEGDYYLAYSETKEEFFPYKDDDDLRNINDSSMWFLAYRKAYVNEKDENVLPSMSIVNYNILQGYIYPLLPNGGKA